MKNTQSNTSQENPKMDASSTELGEGQNTRPSRKLLDFLSEQKWEIFAFFLVALILRFFRLTNSDLWMDEVAIFFDALNGTNENVSNAHLFHLKVVGWFLNTFDDNAFWLRFWGALAGSLAVPIFYTTAGFLKDKNAARIAGCLLAFSPFLIFYSRDANYYGAMGMFACLQLFFVALVINRLYISGIIGLLIVSFLTHINHPFASIFSVFCLSFLILFFILSIIKHRHHLINYLKIKKNLITVLASVLLAGIGAYLLLSYFSATINVLSGKLTLGQGLGNVEFTYSFFVNLFSSLLGSYYHPEGLNGWIKLVSNTLVLLYIASVIYLIVKRNKSGIFIITVHVLSLAAALFVIFNLDFRNFNARYFSFLVPGFFLIISLALPYYSAKKAGRFFNTVVISCALYILAVSPILLRYYFTDHGNYRELAEYLQNNETNFTHVLFPVSEEMAQARFYFDQDELAQIEQIQTRPQLEHLGTNNLKYQVYDRDELTIATAWRHRPMPSYWGLIDETFTKKFQGESIHSPLQDAIVYSWEYQDRVIFDDIATRFDLPKGGSSVLAYTGKWSVQSSSGDAPEPFQTETFTSEKTQRIEVQSDEKETLTFLPILPDKLDYGPFRSVSYTDDFRNTESTRGELPVIEMAFDGFFSYLVYQPEGESRHLVLKKWNESEPDQPTPTATFIYSVAVDGIPVGLFIDQNNEDGLSTIEIDLELSPGNHRVDLYATRLRFSDPFNKWVWAGLEWNKGKSESPSIPLEVQGLNVMTPEKAISWQGNKAGELSEKQPNTPDSYHRKINSSIETPSGDPALEFSFEEPLNHDRDLYSITLSELIPLAPKSILGYSTHIKGVDNQDYAASLYTVFFDKNGNQLGTYQGKQQMTIEPLNGDWRRYVELIPTPPNAALAAPGVFIFTPDTKKTNASGKIYIDSILPIKPDQNLSSSLYVSDKLFFSTGATPWQPGNQATQ